MEWDLLEKTTFWIEDVKLQEADLGQVAAAAAAALELQPHEIMVVDVRNDFVAFDVLVKKVKAEAVIGKEQAILANLRKLEKVQIGKKAGVHSEGVLGFIAVNPKEAADVLKKSENIMSNITKKISERTIVFSSGTEVQKGEIKDTNAPYLIEQLSEKGYKAAFGGIMEDNQEKVAAHLLEAVDNGYGLIITTGGVGAEDKDFTVEAVRQIDPQAHTPWILRFGIDNHRHHKHEVCIAVGRIGLSLIISLPGPHEEVKLGCKCIIDGLAQGISDAQLAENIAEILRNRWRNMMNPSEA